MRPPDENQHGSTRPNLLSSARRHAGSDDNILERLERDSARQASGNRSRAAWYAAAASLVLLVLVVVAWMAYENANPVQVIPVTRVLAERGTAVAAAAAPDAWQAPPQQRAHPVYALTLPGPATILPLDPHEATLARQPAATATAPVRNSAIAKLPPLVLLPEKAAAARKPDLPARSKAAPPTAAVVRSKPVARATPPVQQHATPARTAARTRKPASASLSDDALVDRDVALLSAIITHDSAHADEQAQRESATACARASERICAGRAAAMQK